MARATVARDVLVHLDHNVGHNVGGDYNVCHNDGGDDEDGHRPREIVPARDVPPVPLLGQLIVLHRFRRGRPRDPATIFRNRFICFKRCDRW